MSAQLIDFYQRIASSSWLEVDTEFLREKNVLSTTLLNSSDKQLRDEIKHAKALPKEQWQILKKQQLLTTQQNAVVDALLAAKSGQHIRFQPNISR